MKASKRMLVGSLCIAALLPSASASSETQLMAMIPPGFTFQGVTRETMGRHLAAIPEGAKTNFSLPSFTPAKDGSRILAECKPDVGHTIVALLSIMMMPLMIMSMDMDAVVSMTCKILTGSEAQKCASLVKGTTCSNGCEWSNEKNECGPFSTAAVLMDYAKPDKTSALYMMLNAMTECNKMNMKACTGKCQWKNDKCEASDAANAEMLCTAAFKPLMDGIKKCDVSNATDKGSTCKSAAAICEWKADENKCDLKPELVMMYGLGEEAGKNFMAKASKVLSKPGQCADDASKACKVVVEHAGKCAPLPKDNCRGSCQYNDGSRKCEVGYSGFHAACKGETPPAPGGNIVTGPAVLVSDAKDKSCSSPETVVKFVGTPSDLTKCNPAKLDNGQDVVAQMVCNKENKTDRIKAAFWVGKECTGNPAGVVDVKEDENPTFRCSRCAAGYNEEKETHFIRVQGLDEAMAKLCTTKPPNCKQPAGILVGDSCSASEQGTAISFPHTPTDLTKCNPGKLKSGGNMDIVVQMQCNQSTGGIKAAFWAGAECKGRAAGWVDFRKEEAPSLRCSKCTGGESEEKRKSVMTLVGLKEPATKMCTEKPQTCEAPSDGGGGDKSACDVCKPWSGTLQADKIFHGSCSKGGKELGGSFKDLAACKAAGGEVLRELKCSYLVQLGNTPEYKDPQKCGHIQASFGSTCCGGTYSAKVACDMCEPVSGTMCMYKTPSGCPKAPQYASKDWAPWPDAEKQNEEKCKSAAAEANGACGVKDIEVKWGELPKQEKKCLEYDKVVSKDCLKFDKEMEGDFDDLEACKKAGGTHMRESKCNQLLVYGNSDDMKDPKKCAASRPHYGRMCCTAACSKPAPGTTTKAATTKAVATKAATTAAAATTSMAAATTTQAAATTKKPDATTTTAPAKVEVVRVKYTLKHMDLSKLKKDVKDTLITSIKEGVLSGLPSGHTKDHVKVELSSGSIVADVHITPKAGTTAAQLSKGLDTSKTTQIEKSVMTKVKAVPNIDSALAAGKTMDDVQLTSTSPQVKTVDITPSATKVPGESVVSGGILTPGEVSIAVALGCVLLQMRY